MGERKGKLGVRVVGEPVLQVAELVIRELRILGVRAG